MTNNESEYLTGKEAAEYLGISRQALNERVKKGVLKKYVQEAPRRVLFKRSELNELKRIKKVNE